jgi:hypothetical protein
MGPIRNPRWEQKRTEGYHSCQVSLWVEIHIMSSRALRKLHGKQEIEISTNDDDLEEDETEDKDLQSAVNPFALVWDRFATLAGSKSGLRVTLLYLSV